MSPSDANPALWVPAGIYTRVSTFKQLGRRVESCESQEAICHDFIQSQHKAKGWEHVRTFTDPAYSGATMKRPGMEALMQAVAAGEIKVVVIFKLERVLRSTDEWAPFRAFLAKHNCELVSAMEDISEKTALGRLKNNLLVSVSEYDRLNIAEKVRAKMGEQARRGFWNGGSVPYGYAYDKNTQKLTPHTVEAPIVRRIYERAAELVPLTVLANMLNEEGFRTKQRFLRRRDGSRDVIGQQRFRSDGLRLLLTNPIYRGVVRFEGKEYKGQHDPLVSPELWEQANVAVRETKPRPELLVERNLHQYLLKGLCHCGNCGRAMIPQTCGLSNNAGKRYRYYNCGAVMRDRVGAQCPVGRLSANAVEGAVVAFLGQVSNHPDLVAGVVEATRVRNKGDRQALKASLDALQPRIDQINAELGRCVDVVAKGGAGALGPELMKRAEALRTEQDRLLVEREKLRQELVACDTATFNEKRVQDSLARLTVVLPQLAPDERTELVRLFVDRVEVREPARTPLGAVTGESQRVLALRIKLHLPRLVEGIERQEGQASANRYRPVSDRGVSFETKIDFSHAGRGIVTILAPFNYAVRVSTRGATVAMDKQAEKEPQHLIVRAQRWQRLLESGQVANRVALARRFRVTPGAVTRTLRMIRLVPEIQNFLAGLTSARAVRHFGLTKIGMLADLNRDEQLAAFARIRRAFDQTTPELEPGKPVRTFRSSSAESSNLTDTERIIQLLRKSGPSAPRQIAAEVELSRASTYRCLAALVEAGTVATVGNTKSRTYALKV
jgi:DNA invertase Pin-like site-specific DNA recombinase